jgi:TonB family protein
MARKVLLIEYEPRSIERVRGLLPAPEFAVTEAHDGEEGLSAFTASRFDLVVLSGMLPRLPSAEVIREIRRKGGATAPPILLMVSGYKGTNRKADAQRVGAFDILVKPFEDRAFQDAVSQAIESTDVGVRTMKISAQDAAAASRLTSEDIFSDVLQDVGGEAVRPSPAPAPPPRSAASPAEEVERRLRDTLSGILDRTPPRGTVPPEAARTATPPGATPPPSDKPKFSTDAAIDRMIQDTLSGLRTPAKPRPVAEAGPERPGAAAPARPISGSGPDHFGQYEILEKIASGGMADVYKARRSGVEGFQKIVAIKKILPHLADNEQFIGMFADEAKLAAQLSHPNVVHIHDLGKIEGGGYFIAMEYVDGRDLRAILHSAREVSTPMPVPLAIYVASKVASALDYAHRRRDPGGKELAIVHRDVSPQNILISYEGEIKLCDFGIAKAASKASTTQSGALKGKLQYMSPEQAWGRPIDHRSDLFSLGAVLFEMLTGEKLFRGDSDLNLLEMVRAAEVPVPSSRNPEVPKSLDAILGKTLAREPDERYSSASDLLRDLEAVLYSYTPAPGSADLAIYLHRLQAEEAAAEAGARSAADAAEAEPPKKRRSKGTPVARRPSGSAPRFVEDLGGPPTSPATPPPAASPHVPAPAPAGIYGAPSAARGHADKKGRRSLYAGIAAAFVVLAAGAYWFASRAGGPVRAAVPAPTAPPTPAATAALQPTSPPAAAATPVAAPATPAPPGFDLKAVEAEVQRQLTARKREMSKNAEQAAAPTARPVREASPAPAAPTASEGGAARVETALPQATAPAAAEPTPVAKVVEEKLAAKASKAGGGEGAAVLAPTREPEVRRGDLVGPGPGVVEPTLLAPPRVNYPPLALQRRVSGRVVVLVLVDEDGAVAEARLEQGIASRLGVNEAVVEGVRKSKFKPATKNGVPVKMWRTVIVDVKP